MNVCQLAVPVENDVSMKIFRKMVLLRIVLQGVFHIYATSLGINPYVQHLCCFLSSDMLELKMFSFSV
jgi:hypothetical protein